MALLAVIGGLLICAALALREHQLARERSTLTSAVEHLKASLETTRAQLRRVSEDAYVMQSVLGERNVLDEEELLRGRQRLIEQPRQKAEERAAMARHLKVSPTQVVIDETEPKLH